MNLYAADNTHIPYTTQYLAPRRYSLIRNIVAKMQQIYNILRIALIFSELLAVAIILQQKNNPSPSMKWLIGLINGLLIFINASGINAVSTGLAFENRNSVKVGKASYVLTEDKTTASLFIFKNEVNWWPDLNILLKKDSLEKINIKLIKSNERLAKAFNNIKENCTTPDPDKSAILKRDSILNDKIDRIEREDALLKVELSSLRNKHDSNAKVISTANKTTNTDAENRSNELFVLKKNLEDCQHEKSDLEKKLNKIKNLNQLLREADKYGL